MSIRTFLSSLLKSSPGTRRNRRVRPRHGCRRIELLEQRALLTTYVVDSLADDGSGGTTLREALEAASDNVEVHGLRAGEFHDVIRFDPSLFVDGHATLTLRPDINRPDEPWWSAAELLRTGSTSSARRR